MYYIKIIMNKHINIFFIYFIHNYFLPYYIVLEINYWNFCVDGTIVVPRGS